MKSEKSIILLAFVLLLGATNPFKTTAKEKQKPNIVFIITDDQGMGDLGPFRLEVPIPRDDDIGPVGQNPPDGQKRLSPHDHGMPHGHGLEPFQVGGDMPGQVAVAPDTAVFRHGDDQDNRGHAGSFSHGVSIRSMMRSVDTGEAFYRETRAGNTPCAPFKD